AVSKSRGQARPAFLSPIPELKRTETFAQEHSVNAKTQLEIDFTPGLTEQFPEFADCLKASVYGCGKAFKVVAADLDMRASELSRKLANNSADNVHFPAQLLPALIEATGDVPPSYWRVAEFREDSDARQNRGASELCQLVDVLHVKLKQAGLK